MSTIAKWYLPFEIYHFIWCEKNTQDFYPLTFPMDPDAVSDWRDGKIMLKYDIECLLKIIHSKPPPDHDIEEYTSRMYQQYGAQKFGINQCDKFRRLAVCFNPDCNKNKYLPDFHDKKFVKYCIDKGMSPYQTHTRQQLESKKYKAVCFSRGFNNLPISQRKYIRVKFYLCKKCRVARYCSRKCQKIDWNKYSHKTVCSPISRL